MGKPVTASAKENIANQMAMCEMLLHSGSVGDSVGAACSYLLYVANLQPDVLRRVMNEKIIREGFMGVSLLETIQRVCK